MAASVILVIRDGWGIHQPSRDPDEVGDATRLAATPVAEVLAERHPRSLLWTHGEHVGLPAEQMGNSEVGHLNLGAGRVVYQQLTRIDRAIERGELADNPVLVELLAAVSRSGGTLHLMGLTSDGGVHSDQAHLHRLLEVAAEAGQRRLAVHCFTDGRDTPPTRGAEYLQSLAGHLQALGSGRIASVIGRYYAMDRDRHWDRTHRAYDCLTGEPEATHDDPVAALRRLYDEEVTDEFVPPFRVAAAGDDPEAGRIRDGDGVLFFNFRSDRARQLTRALTAEDFDGFERRRRPRVAFACMSEYDPDLELPVLFPPREVAATLADVVAAAGRRQFHIAETEKYAHVTYFFNGGREEPVPGEERLLVPSPPVATYDLQPEMSAAEVTAELVERIRSRRFAFLLVNYANPDMVGHTGSLDAAIRAVEATDRGVGEVLEAAREVGAAVLVTADHGNAEQMIDDDGGPHTAHTTNRVEIYYVADDSGERVLADGALADVAPTVLELLGLPVPDEMEGVSLLRSVARRAAADESSRPD